MIRHYVDHLTINICLSQLAPHRLPQKMPGVFLLKYIYIYIYIYGKNGRYFNENLLLFKVIYIHTHTHIYIYIYYIGLPKGWKF